MYKNTKMINVSALALVVVISAISATSGLGLGATLASEDKDIFEWADPVNGNECPSGFNMVKDGGECVRINAVDCDDDPTHFYCDGSEGMQGMVYCDIYAQLTGSEVAAGGCYDRN